MLPRVSGYHLPTATSSSTGLALELGLPSSQPMHAQLLFSAIRGLALPFWKLKPEETIDKLKP
jgi:hypothetical protein